MSYRRAAVRVINTNRGEVLHPLYATAVGSADFK